MSADKPDVAALIAELRSSYQWQGQEIPPSGRELKAAAALQSQQARIAELERRDADNYHYNRAETAEARVAELESALREIADMSSDDTTECCIAREALKGSGK